MGQTDNNSFVKMYQEDWQSIVDSIYEKTLDDNIQENGLTANQVSEKIEQLYTIYSEDDDLSQVEEGDVFLVVSSFIESEDIPEQDEGE